MSESIPLLLRLFRRCRPRLVGVGAHTSSIAQDLETGEMMTINWDLSTVASWVELQPWQLECAKFVGMLPNPADEKSWSAEQVEQIRRLVSEIEGRFGKIRPLGATKCAPLLAERVNRDVVPNDIRVLAERGHLEVVGTYKPPDDWQAHALFAPAKVDALAVEQVDAVVTARQQGTTATVSDQEASAMLGWRGGQFMVAVHMKKIEPNMVGRFARADVTALAADSEFQEQLRQLFGGVA
ncbi:hypothetical protein AB0N05_14965 [Nocardia sp. NPDC051030]|uniref:hypothetical protein n=1 Tax=Nocardia sp. NPDC051030 TaxID=3155162 RepID=UPI00342C67D0